MFISRQDQDPESTFIDLTDEESCRALRQLCKDHEADVLIIDNFTTVTDGLEDENASVAFKGTQGFFLTMKQLGVTTILVHHARKDGKQFRGSQTLEVTFEAIISLEQPPVPTIDRASFVLSFRKFRAKGDGRLQSMHWSLDPIAGWQLSEDTGSLDQLEQVVRAVKSLDHISYKEIGDALAVNKSTISRRLRRARAQKLISEKEIEHCLQQAREMRHCPDLEDEDDDPDLEDDPDSDY